MDIKASLKGQYHAGLAMLRDTITACPEETWLSGKHPRNYWRIVFHTLYYTHLYLHQDEESCVHWSKCRKECRVLWDEPEIEEPYTQAEMLSYLAEVDAGVDSLVDALDLDTEKTGFSWYTDMGKLDHQLLSLRHLQGHVGQLSEILMQAGIDTEWVGIAFG